MIPLAINGMGAFTSIGPDVPSAMAGILTSFQNFDDLPISGPNGEPITGAASAIDPDVSGFDRYVGMARFALAECAGEPSERPVDAPLLLAIADADLLPFSPEAVLDSLSELFPGRIDRRGSRVFATGKVGQLTALIEARRMIAERHAIECFVGGVDSLLDAFRLRQLLDSGRILHGAGADGFVPGEAAVFLRLGARAGRDAGNALLGLAIEDDASAREDGVSRTGRGLSRAALAALQTAGIPLGDVRALVHDASGEQAGFDEVAQAVGRLPFQPDQRLDRWAPAFSVGETGAAGALLGLAMSSFFIRERQFAGPALNLVTTDAATRGAFVVGPIQTRNTKHG